MVFPVWLQITTGLAKKRYIKITADAGTKTAPEVVYTLPVDLNPLTLAGLDFGTSAASELNND